MVAKPGKHKQSAGVCPPPQIKLEFIQRNSHQIDSWEDVPALYLLPPEFTLSQAPNRAVPGPRSQREGRTVRVYLQLVYGYKLKSSIAIEAFLLTQCTYFTKKFLTSY